MIYTASYFEPQNHHGQLISISRTVPKGFKVDDRQRLFVPSRELLADWKEGLTEEAYTECFRSELGQRWTMIKEWLRTLQPEHDATYLCWEKQGEFCHRNLFAQMLQRHRPDCFGGCDLPTVQAAEVESSCWAWLEAMESRPYLWHGKVLPIYRHLYPGLAWQAYVPEAGEGLEALD